MTGSTDRRRFIRTAGILAGSSALAGCGTNSESQRSPVSPTTSDQPGDANLRNELGLTYPSYELEEQLDIYQWLDYWPQQTITDFEDAYGVTVTVDTYNNMSMMLDNLGSKNYDLLFPADFFVSILVDQDEIRPLDMEKLPNWSNLADRWGASVPYDPGPERYSAPYQWGTTGIGWHNEMIEAEEITSWDAMWDPTYSGQMTMLNVKRETIGAALRKLGYSVNTTDQRKIEEAKAELIRQKDLLIEYNVVDDLTNQNASPTHVWSGVAMDAYINTLSDGSSPIEYRIPEEGSVRWIDSAVVPKHADHPNLAHAFINYFLNPRVNAIITNYSHYNTPNEPAEEHLKDELVDNTTVRPPDSTFDRLEFIRSVGDASQYYDEAWSEVESA